MYTHSCTCIPYITFSLVNKTHLPALIHHCHIFVLFLFSGDSLQPPQTVSEASASSADPVVRSYGNQRQMLSSTAQPTFTQNLATEPESHGEGSPNDDLTVYPDDHTLQGWEKVEKVYNITVKCFFTGCVELYNIPAWSRS